MHTKKPELIGAHMSAAGGVHHALLEGAKIGATTIQLFTANQKQWHSSPISEKECGLWQEALEKTGISSVMSHDSYLINLGSPNPDVLHKSQHAFAKEIKRCHQLELAFLNFHPGAATTSTTEACLEQIIKSLTDLRPTIEKGATRLLIETTAGQGTVVGWNFEHIGYLVSALHSIIPIGVCIDTCHIFAAGYDIGSKAGWDETLHAFETHIGLKHLYALHVNDSMNPLGSRKDRHAPLGAGCIGINAFKAMMQHPKLRHLPKYLETPEGPPLWEKEIALLRTFAHETHKAL